MPEWSHVDDVKLVKNQLGDRGKCIQHSHISQQDTQVSLISQEYLPNRWSYHLWNCTLLRLQAVTDSYLRSIQAAELRIEASSRADAAMTPICQTPMADSCAVLVTPAEGSKFSGHFMTKLARSANEIWKTNQSPWRAGWRRIIPPA